LNTVRTEFDVPKLPFIAGDFVQLWKGKNLECCSPIVDAMKSVCEQLGNGGFVESDGLLSNFEVYGKESDDSEDEIHFSRAALYELGARYYKVYIKIAR